MTLSRKATWNLVFLSDLNHKNYSAVSVHIVICKDFLRHVPRMLYCQTNSYALDSLSILLRRKGELGLMVCMLAEW